MKTGLSLYFSSGMKKNREIIQKAAEIKVPFLFTSLHIPDESNTDYLQNIKELLFLCREKNLQLIIDVGPETLKKPGIGSIESLKQLGIRYIRLDYGFTAKETVQLSELFHIVFNASTVSEGEIIEWRRSGADFGKFLACHNFYPKPYSGLSIQSVRDTNFKLKMSGFQTMAFVPGDYILRGPLHEGLPTIEAHRHQKGELALQMLELFQNGLCDVVFVGDIDISEQSWRQLSCLNEKYVELHAQIIPAYEFIRETIHHDRPDSSDFIFRSVESRAYSQQVKPERSQSKSRLPGSICISNQNYLRYMGEVEISRTDLPWDERLNQIGQIAGEDLRYLDLIRNGMGISLIN